MSSDLLLLAAETEAAGGGLPAPAAGALPAPATGAGGLPGAKFWPPQLVQLLAASSMPPVPQSTQNCAISFLHFRCC